MRILNVLIYILLLAGCDDKSRSNVANNVLEFRELYNKSEFSAIYLDSSEDLKNAISEGEFSAFLEKEVFDIGKYKGDALLNTTITNGKDVSLTYQTEYEKDYYLELFIYRKENGVYKLYYYTVDTQKRLVLDPITHALKLPNF
ncbi:DUF3887 domain-containing protein [Rahnella ecdela]|uniref:DUF4878 domain-containing protein n=1 Tax=Rahnella ecdela TaxID=2816250 RepID=A0ABS6LB03_9GAMM|nr:DUF3887 domain-containing protein [Rahnella ecdela]MBU9844109.1 hypothetical protein [Rahnella ecdela]